MEGRGTLQLRTFCGMLPRVSVEDSGSGMSQEVIARCTEPFFTTKEDKETGLASHGIPRDGGARGNGGDRIRGGFRTRPPAIPPKRTAVRSTRQILRERGGSIWPGEREASEALEWMDGGPRESEPVFGGIGEAIENPRFAQAAGWVIVEVQGEESALDCILVGLQHGIQRKPLVASWERRPV